MRDLKHNRVDGRVRPWFYVTRLIVLLGVNIFFVWFIVKQGFSSKTAVLFVFLGCSAFALYLLIDNIRYLMKILGEGHFGK